MNNDIKTIEENLNDIIQKNADAIKGYDKAAENAKEVGLQNYFKRKSAERKTFLTALKRATPALELKDSDDGSTAGTAHRTWMDIKAFFSGDNDEAMLEEAIRGDKAAVEEYNEVLGNVHVPVEAKAIIREQRDRISRDLTLNKSLEDLR